MAKEIFRDAEKLIDPALVSVVDCLAPVLREAVHYHYGWAGKNGRPVIGERGGSGRHLMLFALLCAGVDGGPVERGLPGAVADSLATNAGIVHDDIMDTEVARRGRPTLHHAYGTERALMVGDALLGLAFSHLGEHRHPRARQALRSLSDSWIGVCAGQTHDVELEGHAELTLSQAIAVSEGKSGRGVGGTFRVPVLLTDACDAQVEAVSQYGFHLGMAVQYRNDLLDLWPTNTLERVPYGDIRRRKMTPMVAACLESGHPGSRRLAEYYRAQSDPAEEDLEVIADLIDQCGGRGWALEQNREHMRLADQSLQEASPPPELYRDLCVLGSHFRS
ncbi:polyprenyl synthetase family protein [Streptomyces acidicola]|uniref:polyprenyl synthetase family protein n=1 Tax=Streptomyces acidicola TaxID=2596892 RepID=UPI0038201530